MKKKGRGKKTGYDVVEWEQPKCIKQRTERVNVGPSVCEWGGQGKKRVEVFR